MRVGDSKESYRKIKERIRVIEDERATNHIEEHVAHICR